MVHLNSLLILVLSELAVVSYWSKYPYYLIVCLNLLEWIIGTLIMEQYVCFHSAVCCFACIYFINCFNLYSKHYHNPFCFFLMIFVLITQHLNSNLISSIQSFKYSNLYFVVVNNYFIAIHFISLLGFLVFY
jgi:hypothetical protein